MKERIAITSTVPVEVLYAAGVAAVDINNLFIADRDPRRFVRQAEDDGFPGNSCAWIKGIYGALRESGIRKVVAVVQGDCSNTISLAERLTVSGVEIIPFAYPYDADKARLQQEVERLMRYFGADWEQVRKAKRRLDAIRRKVWKIDEAAWRDGTVSGFENHLWQVTCSDFKGDPDLFEKEVDLFLGEVAQREKHKDANRIRLGYIGVPPIAGDLFRLIERSGGSIVFNEVQRQFSMPFNTEDIVEQYVRYTYPYGIAGKLNDVRAEIGRRKIDGIIHYVQTFCHHQIEADIFHRGLDIPMLVVECDKPGVVEGKDRTRIEAFIDSLQGALRKTGRPVPDGLGAAPRAAKTGMISCGIDLGSRHAKVVFMRDRSIVKEMLFDTVDFYRSFGARDGAVFRVDIAGWGLAPDRIVATGYGRENISFAEGAVMPEIQAHAAGAVFLAGLRSCVLIDIGGQDVKVIKVADGQVVHFAVNDKCAAGTGRYLEHMSRVLGIGIDELGMSADDPVILSSTCAVFSETELTGKIAAGIPVRRLAAGVNYSAFMKLKPLLLKVWRGEPVILTGGGAKNKSFSHFLRKEIGCEIIEIARPQFAGAVGCSLAGLSEAAV